MVCAVQTHIAQGSTVGFISVVSSYIHIFSLTSRLADNAEYRHQQKQSYLGYFRDKQLARAFFLWTLHPLSLINLFHPIQPSAPAICNFSLALHVSGHPVSVPV